MKKLCTKIFTFFLRHINILFDNQFGFRKNNLTTHALIQITELIKKSIDKGKYGCGIFIDLRKAFDTVNHEILLTKLEHYSIRGNMLDWFRSYLSKRKQYISINGQSSQLLDITCGVPQGSVLGPLLFLIYINDLPNVSEVLNFYLFADDTNICYESKTLKDIEKTINEELNKLFIWLNVNRLSLNIDKTKCIIFHPYNKPMKDHITIKINNKVIDQKEYIKYLGVLMDSTLSWKFHISNISKKILRSIGIMYKLRPFLPLKVMKDVYYSLIYLHIIYAIEVWGSTFKTELNKILILQKRALRLMTFSDLYPDTPGPLCPSNPIFPKLNMLKVSDIHKYQVLKFVFKSINRLAPEQFHDWFQLNHESNRYKTRSNFNIDSGSIIKNLVIPYARTTNYGMKQLKVNGPRLWNLLPSNIKNTTSLFVFLKSLKSLYVSEYE